MVSILKALFDGRKTKFIEKEKKYIELTFEVTGIFKTSQIELLKLRVNNPITQLSDRIKIIEDNCENLLKQIEELQIQKVDIKEKIKHIKKKLYKEFEQILLSKYKKQRYKRRI